MRFAKNILLTGAGFTKTFGGFLGSEMWAAIFNRPEVRADNKLRECMLRGNLNYEAVYESVIFSPDSEFDALQKSLFSKAVRAAYGDMDRRLYEQNLADKANFATCARKFINRFVERQDSRTFFFTLNQDILMERFFSTDHFQPSLPGFSGFPHWFNDRIGEDLRADEIVAIPDADEVEKAKESFWAGTSRGFMYVKLHGSYGWRAKNGVDTMIIGHGKFGRIVSVPLLEWYLSLFKEALEEGDKNLVIVGYGFGDEHINEIIAESICDHRLKLFVISPQLPADFAQLLQGVSGSNPVLIKRGHEIWNGLHGYYPSKVSDFYYPYEEALPALAHNFFDALELD